MFSCPFVIGSKEPGKMAIRFIEFQYKERAKLLALMRDIRALHFQSGERDGVLLRDERYLYSYGPALIIGSTSKFVWIGGDGICHSRVFAPHGFAGALAP